MVFRNGGGESFQGNKRKKVICKNFSKISHIYFLKWCPLNSGHANYILNVLFIFIQMYNPIYVYIAILYTIIDYSYA